MNETLNPPSERKEIHAILESCRTPKGGYTNLFMEHMGVQLINGWQLPPAWKKNLEDYGDLEDIKARASVHLGKSVDASRPEPEVVESEAGNRWAGMKFLAVDAAGVMQLVKIEDLIEHLSAIAAEARQA